MWVSFFLLSEEERLAEKAGRSSSLLGEREITSETLSFVRLQRSAQKCLNCEIPVNDL